MERSFTAAGSHDRKEKSAPARSPSYAVRPGSPGAIDRTTLPGGGVDPPPDAALQGTRRAAGHPSGGKSGPAAGAPGMLDRLVMLVSIILNPLLMSALAVGLVATGYGAPTEEVWAVFGLSIMFMFAIPVFYLFVLQRGGRIDDISVRDRMKRRWPMIISIVLMIILYPSLLAVTQSTAPAVLSVAGIYLVNMILMLLITVRYRISLHAAGLASFVSVCAVFGAIPTFAGIPGGAGLFLVATAALPLIAWARIRRREHGIGEVMAGIVFGLVVPAVELALLMAIGVL